MNNATPGADAPQDENPLPTDILEKMGQVHGDMLAKHGFYVHYVPNDPQTDPGVNAHTHGFEETWGHVDFQIVLPLNPEMVHGIFWSLANAVKAGKKFAAGDHEGVITNFSVRMVEAWENDREVLRVLLPDESGKFPDDEGCEEKYVLAQTPENEAFGRHK